MAVVQASLNAQNPEALRLICDSRVPDQKLKKDELDLVANGVVQAPNRPTLRDHVFRC